MKSTVSKRILALVLTLCLMLGLIPVFGTVEAEAVSGVNSLTCSSFISNAIARSYIDTMMRYYINNYSSLQTALNGGKSVVFMFEGGSDNYWNGSTYADAVGDVRNQAVCIVVKTDSAGKAYIAYSCENCSSVPDDPQNCTNGVAYSGATTVMDGIHSFYTWNHTGPYGAFQLSLSQGYYTPANNLNGYTAGASGLNIHTRSTNTCGGAAAGWNWSLGCQVIGSGYYTGNEFNEFMKVVAGISYNVWLDYYNKSFNTISTGTTKGYYVVDRQLGKLDTSGKEYGSGSLIQLYNTTALSNITSFSTNAAKAAGALNFEYSVAYCTYYPAYCKVKATREDGPINSQPCSVSTTYNSTTIETAVAGNTYTATGLFKNGYGNYWYRIITSSGKTGYIYGGECEYIEQITSDLKITDYEIPNGHVKGATFYVNGTVKTEYNDLTEVSCYIYNGIGDTGTAPVTGTTDNPATNSYTLKGSTVDDATWMGTLAVGNYTYVISAKYTNYYAIGATELKSNSAMVELVNEYFAVIPAAADQAACTHTNTTYVLEESTCLQNGSSLTVCSTCGKITKNVTSGGHSYGDWSTAREPGCTDEGLRQRTCSRCGDVQSQAIPARGHSYSTVTHPATCQEYQRIEYTCNTCGHNYSVYADELMTQWQESKPLGIDDSLIETKTQYRYSDYETKTSNSATLAGYTQIGKEWIKSGTGYDHYVKSWDSGYDTSHSVYSQYKQPSFVLTETATSKREYSGSETLVGYVYYHWCRNSYTAGPINRTTSKTNDGTHTHFHSFVAALETFDPTTKSTASDGSVTFANASGCTDSHWWYYIPVYEKTYTDYTAQYTFERWTDYSPWSDEPVAASDTRKVETRTLYRYVDAELGGHDWVNGVCGTCQTVCQHPAYEGGFCADCGEAEPIRDYYLFGYINGANYACEEDYTNMGIYLFEDGKLTVKFNSDSYVGVKTGDNQSWYMTNGWLGSDVSSATLYKTGTVSSPDKLFVPGGVEVKFTLTVNEDGTLHLSYEAERIVLPSVTVTGVSVSFEDEILYNIYYDASNLDDVVEMGLITFNSKLSDGNIDNAVDVIPGYVTDGNEYMVRSNGIPAKNMGDALYFKVYAKLTNGSYFYSGVSGYHAGIYAKSILNKSTNPKMKALCVAMVNYGAAAQLYFNYNTDNLINAFLTEEQKLLVNAYDESMVDDLVAPPAAKTAGFVKNGMDSRSVSVSFDGAFMINYYCTPTYEPEGGIRIYYWDQATLNAVSQLTTANATLSGIMVKGSGEYWAGLSGIPAKGLDQPCYVALVYTHDGVTYSTGVMTYSLGAYCQSKASGSSEIKDLAAATAVYGYYAKAYFAVE